MGREEADCVVRAAQSRVADVCLTMLPRTAMAVRGHENVPKRCGRDWLLNAVITRSRHDPEQPCPIVAMIAST